MSITAVSVAFAISDAYGQAPEASSPPLRAEAPRGAIGDGRTAVPVSVSGGPAADEAEMADYPILPTLDCEAAAVLAATHEQPPAVLAPGVPRQTELACTVAHRGQSTRLALTLRPPTSGLFAEVSPPRANAGEPQVSLRAFVADARGIVAAGEVRAAASAGAVSGGARGELTLTLPEGKAPRAIAVALTDGKRAGAAFLPLVGRTLLPIDTRPRTDVRVRIAGRWFGPVHARRRKVELPIEVPPGAWIAVVRATDKRGNAKESLADLQTPSLPRIAAVARVDALSVEATTEIVVALASARGGPGDPETGLRAEAELGTLEQPKSLGGGVWTISYRAPPNPGDERIEIRVADDADAGSARVGLRVVPGAPATLTLSVPNRAHGPGEELVARVVALDRRGNRVSDAAIEASLGSEVVTARITDGEAELRVKLPERLPDDNRLALVVSSGGARAQAEVRSRPDPPVSARLSADADGRRATVWLDVRDAHGNLADRSEFEVRVGSADLVGVALARGRYRAAVRANESARDIEVSVLANERELGRTRVRLAPPHGALVLVAFAGAGWLDNGGELSVPRGGAGVGLRIGLGPLEWAFLAGVEAYDFRDQQQAQIGGVEQAVTRSLRVLAIPLQLRGRLPLTGRLGVAVGAALVPMGVDASLSTDVQPADEQSSWIIGARAQLSADLRLGPGRAILTASRGRARLSEGPLVGNIDGWGVLVGYEWWALDLGR